MDNTNSTPANAPASAAPETKPEIAPGITFTDTTFRFPLEHPIMIGEQKVEWLTLRQPRAGELRGLNLLDLPQLDIDALLTLLPRISTPIIMHPFGAQLHPADLITIGKGVSGFFGSTRQRQELLEQMQAVRTKEE